MGIAQGAVYSAAVVSRWPRSRRSVPRARHQLTATLREWGLQSLADPAGLVLSELVTNAVRHAGAPRDREIETRFLRLSDDRVRIEVHDASPQPPVMRRTAETDEGGR